jgi:hypothetical protein
MGDHVVSATGPVGDPSVQRLDSQTTWSVSRDQRVEPPAQAVDLDDVASLNPFQSHQLEG